MLSEYFCILKKRIFSCVLVFFSIFTFKKFVEKNNKTAFFLFFLNATKFYLSKLVFLVFFVKHRDQDF